MLPSYKTTLIINTLPHGVTDVTDEQVMIIIKSILLLAFIYWCVQYNIKKLKMRTSQICIIQEHNFMEIVFLKLH